ncbi:MAG TPA: BTAD domain-containing putative transcriptional regulator [Thermoleophilaceae bacterium]|nr:BTAD domain-containing putative transcriptional regulator [Thermoleophilaceae bacterium]
MDFKILGPLEVDDGDGPIPLGGVRQRALLGLLLLHANEVVSRDRLIEELWGGAEDAFKRLQVAVSRLRKALGPAGPLVTRPPGYELRLEPGRLDLDRFENEARAGREALAAGDAKLARARLGDALAVWRGPALADLVYEPFAQAEAGRLEELRASVTEDRIAADLELGRHADLVGELQELVTRHPLRERLRRQLMLALYRSGRQADALEVYGDARRALTGELGIEPGRELRELQEAILRQEPGLDGGRPARAPAPERGTFVGRERELAQLAGALDDALAGRGRMVLIQGEPGIGKSRLADELMARARAGGARVVVGRCWEAGGAPAYWPWVQSLRAYVRELDPGALRAQLGNGGGDLAQLLPELGDLVDDLPPPPARESEGARFRLFEAAASFMGNAAEAAPLVLMLDDLHAADEPSLLLLRFLAREMAETHLLVVCAFRDVDPMLQEALTATLVELAREPHTARISLGGLAEGDVAKYIERSTAQMPPAELVGAIHRETDGNPLFVAEVVQLLVADGQIAEPGAQLRIPPGVREVIGRRLARLPAGSQDLLVSASVLGREFGLGALERLSELPRDELLDALDQAMAERVVTDVPGTRERLRFGHALIRDSLYDALNPARRQRLHEAAAAALEEVYAGDLEPHLAELAFHLFAADPSAVGPKAVDYARRAGDRAAAQAAYEEAVRLYGMAITLVTEDDARCGLLVALGDAQARAGDTPASKRSLLDAADLAEKLGLVELLTRAALGYGGRLVWEVSRGDAHHLAILERALLALGDEDSSARVHVLARMAGGPLREINRSAARRRALSDEALAVARRLEDPATLAWALAGYIAANHSPEFTQTQVELATEEVGIALAAGDLERAVEGHEHRATARIELGLLSDAKADYAAMEELAGELRQPTHDWFVAVHKALLALLEGRLGDAEALVAHALDLGERAQSWSADICHTLQLFVLRRDQGRLGEIEQLVRRAADENPTYLILRCERAVMAAELGQDAEARAALAELVGNLTFDEEWLVSMGFLAETAHALEDTRSAAVLYELLRAYPGRVAISYPEISTGSVSRPLGLLATTLTRWEDAARHFETALEMNARIGARSWLAHTQHEYARMLATRDAPGDAERADQLTAEALSAYRELGIAH